MAYISERTNEHLSIANRNHRNSWFITFLIGIGILFIAINECMACPNPALHLAAKQAQLTLPSNTKIFTRENAKNGLEGNLIKPIDVHPGENIALQLESNPSTGYSFQMTSEWTKQMQDNSAPLRLQSCHHSRQAPNTGGMMMGAPGLETWWFTVEDNVRNGQIIPLELHYVKAWAINEPVHGKDRVLFEFIVR